MLEWKGVKIYPEWIQDLWKYFLVLAILCAISKVVYDVKEHRRLQKLYAEYQQRRADDE